MEQVTAVGKGTTFFLLLVLATSASATSLNTPQNITATSGKQVKGVWDVCARAQNLRHFKSMWENLQYTPYNRRKMPHIIREPTLIIAANPVKFCLQVMCCWWKNTLNFTVFCNSKLAQQLVCVCPHG